MIAIFTIPALFSYSLALRSYSFCPLAIAMSKCIYVTIRVAASAVTGVGCVTLIRARGCRYN